MTKADINNIILRVVRKSKTQSINPIDECYRQIKQLFNNQENIKLKKLIKSE